ncbi:hypothetical protein CEXT_756671 [Caerostris extrusa]|uniref:Uncharacterized protein n=1 Tax=Caerostris extrusa TaxID=172846 RepID=A0AAV4PE13_CAEEX|nr:hypothetical protein CEXT_756671 [Caerostris extrusa]
MDPLSPTFKIINYIPFGTRTRGCLKLRWTDCVEVEFKVLRVTNWKTVAKQRSEWKKFHGKTWPTLAEPIEEEEIFFPELSIEHNFLFVVMKQPSCCVCPPRNRSSRLLCGPIVPFTFSIHWTSVFDTFSHPCVGHAWLHPLHQTPVNKRFLDSFWKNWSNATFLPAFQWGFFQRPISVFQFGSVDMHRFYDNVNFQQRAITDGVLLLRGILKFYFSAEKRCKISFWVL